MDPVMERAGRGGRYRGALSLALFAVGGQRPAAPRTRRLPRLCDGVVDSVGAAGYGLAGLCHYCHCLYVESRKASADTPDATLFEVRPQQRGCRDHLAATRPTFGRWPAALPEFDRNGIIHRPDGVYHSS